jgi:mannose-6-phosphate isomerase
MKGEIRPWGSYIVLFDADNCKVKMISVNPGHRLSYQYHNHRREVWTVIAGSGILTLEGEEIRVGKDSVIEIPTGSKHRIQNTGSEVMTFVEVQTGTYFGEDDIVRLQDDYSR